MSLRVVLLSVMLCGVPYAAGVNHNIPVLRDIITQPRFVAGDINTGFIQEVYPEGFKGQLECHSLVAPSRELFNLNLKPKQGNTINLNIPFFRGKQK